MCNKCVLGFVFGVGSEFAVSDGCSDGCDWSGEGECLMVRGVCVGGTRNTGGVSAADDVRMFWLWWCGRSGGRVAYGAWKRAYVVR